MKEKGIDKEARAKNQRMQPKYRSKNETVTDFSRRRNHEIQHKEYLSDCLCGHKKDKAGN